MDESHATPKPHVCRSSHFPPYFREQTTQPEVEFYIPNPNDLGFAEFSRTGCDEIYDDPPSYGLEPSRRLPPTPPLTPQQARGCGVASCWECGAYPGYWNESSLEVLRRNSLTTPIFVQTTTPLRQPPQWNMEEGEETRYSEGRRRWPEFVPDQREEVRPIPLQDPPKSKFKRQLSEDELDSRQTETRTRDTNIPTLTPMYNRQGPIPSSVPVFPRTPQPENAQRAFSFNQQDVAKVLMSPSRDCGPRPSQQIDRGPIMTYDDITGSRSPKRVKAEDGSTRPPMSPLVHGSRSSAPHSTRCQPQEPPFFVFPDRVNPNDDPIITNYEPYYVYTNEPRRISDQGQLERLPNHYYPETYVKRMAIPSARRSVPSKPSPERPPRVLRYEVCPEGYSQPWTRQEVFQSCSAHVKHPLRSQSNIESSPNKKELEEMEPRKYNHSLSKPDGDRDMRSMEKQMMFYHSNTKLPPSGQQRYDFRERQEIPTCRQLFGDIETKEPLRCPSLSRQTERIEERAPGYLLTSSEGYDYFLVSHPTSLPDETGSEAVHMQTRRRSLSFSKNTHNSFSPMKRRSVSPGKRRNKGEVLVRVNCSDVARDEKELSEKLQSQTDGSTCNCQSLQAQVLKIAEHAFAQTKRDDRSKEAFERFQTEIQKTNQMIAEALRTANALKAICGKHRKPTSVFTGSVVIALQCQTLASLETLRDMYISGDLKQYLYRVLIPDFLLKVHDVRYVLMSVKVDKEDFDRCRKELESSLLTPTIHISTPGPTLSPLKRETKSVENLENLPTFPQSPVHMRSASNPVLMTSSPLASPSFLTKSPSTPTKKERKFSFSATDRRKGRQPFRERKHSFPGDVSPLRTVQPHCSPPCSPSKRSYTPRYSEEEARRQQSSPRLRKSLEDITSDMANFSVQR